MFFFLLALLIACGLFVMVVVLLQAGKGGGLAAMGGGMGTETFIGGRQAATMLVKATWTGGAIFLGLALILSMVSSRQQAPDTILRQEFQQGPVTPQPVLPREGAAPPGDQPAQQPIPVVPPADPPGGGSL